MRKRVVLDANVFASALMKIDGTPAKVVLATLSNDHFELVLSKPILDELGRILFYPRVRKRIHKTDQEISVFLDALSINSYFVSQQNSYKLLVNADPDDDIYLIAAHEGKAQYLISGDQHLLKIKEFEEVKILTPAEFLLNIAI